MTTENNNDQLTAKEIIELLRYSVMLSDYIQKLTKVNKRIVAQNTRLKKQNRELQNELKILKTTIEET